MSMVGGGGSSNDGEPDLASGVAAPKGIYMHGSSGCGKSILMDRFLAPSILPPEGASEAWVRRVHLHEFLMEARRRARTLLRVAWRERLPCPAPEFWGGLLVAIGLLTRPASLLLFATMACAVYFHLASTGLQGFPLGHVENYSYNFEEPVLYALIFWLLSKTGAGSISIDEKIAQAFDAE
ncbi:hypothetical protein EMIHUDRAFT_252882 [Emiliania huxleyi CCMP1516]|uniref:Uncharacterized protein n=2 Tax=Emiliania huxleyi TaxID=2903 RepID=A0A0D3KFH4_EMIH1|nr:hypothetical protein EMIHUDRAFT_252882 [Emiliania huxleyi CCMP1516]EOD34509.1 hypothetical protein EMIHUDRAFT_252882 [Emiliania huxleyi CCMP1516]|eukprot:XP_005786938.1 hypothetical protein EMIHUDRAFT_252882 [Emiliania huxleyi CCMP1516]